MDVNKLGEILKRKIEQATEDLNRKIESLRASAARTDPSTYALTETLNEIRDLRTRIATLNEMVQLLPR